MKTKLLNEKGSTLLEVALMLPLFLLGMFLILWISVIVNTKNSLISAVENGVRLASTRGKAGLFEGQPIGVSSDSDVIVGQIEELDKYYFSKQDSELGVIKELLVYNTTGSNFEDVYSDYIETVFSALKDEIIAHRPAGSAASDNKLRLNDLPPYYMYAIAYITKAMRMSVGDSIRYPCDPYDKKKTDDKKGENCLMCRPINPATMSDEPFVPTDEGLDLSILLRRVAIRCDFKPSGVIVRPLLSMLGFLIGEDINSRENGVMTHFTYFDAYEECLILPGKLTTGEPYSKYCCRDYRGDNNYYCF